MHSYPRARMHTGEVHTLTPQPCVLGQRLALDLVDYAISLLQREYAHERGISKNQQQVLPGVWNEECWRISAN